jgi:predicted ATPase/DNA-binding CsgD family transcriptional regulator
LPQEPNSFVGRERELGELRRLVAEARALTLCGAGGIGKTRLALRLLGTLAAEEPGEFPDGVWLVELGDLRQPELVVSSVASAVGVGEEPGRPLLDTLAEALRPRRLVLALDNCEHLVQACADVSQRLLAASPGLRLIATSREPLRVAAERVWHVPPLAVAPAGALGTPEEAVRYEAIRLFADRAAASLPGFAVGPANGSAVAALCRALDGMPLAIELAAARVPVLSVEQIAARLADRFGLLTTGHRTAPLRQRTLRAAIDWSHELLTGPEQLLLRRLSVFAGWSLEMAEHVCHDDQIPAAGVFDLLASLVNKSLVVVDAEVLGQARYRLLDTIRAYAAERLADAGESETFQRRLRDYTVTVAERSHALGMAQLAGPWSARVDVFRRYDADAGNVHQVLSQCLAACDVYAGLRIAVAVSPCWIVRGTYAEGAEWLDSFLSLATPGVPPGVQGAAWVVRGQLALSRDPAAAESWADAGLALCRAAGNEFWTAAALNLLAEVALHTGRATDAATCADEALAIAQQAGDGWNEGYALGTRAATAGFVGKLREAQQLAQACLIVMRRIDQQWGCARALLGLANLARMRGDPGEARSRYTEALATLREIDARPEIARCLAGLGRVALEQGAPGLARQHLAESLRLSHSTGSRIGVARVLAAFAALAAGEDRPELAVQLTAAAAALRSVAGLPPLSGARIEKYLAAARRLGEPAVARLWAEGQALSSEAAVALALAMPHAADAAGTDGGAAGEVAGGAVGAAAASTGAVVGAGAVVRAGTARSSVADYQPAAALPGTLTPRERQVAALIASGLSNKAIAGELVISPATAARHVANILAKLGFSSRTQIAAWAVDKQFELMGAAIPRASAQRA